MCASSCEVMHPFHVSLFAFSGRCVVFSHLGSADIDTMLPDQMPSMSVNDRVSGMRRIKHLGGVEQEGTVHWIDSGMSSHPILSHQ